MPTSPDPPWFQCSTISQSTWTAPLLRPGEPGWDQARQAWHLDVDQHPAAVALVSTAPQSTGHNAGPLGDLAETVLLRTGLMRDVEIDTVARVARVQAGAWWMDVTNAAADHGLAALAGSSPEWAWPVMHWAAA